MSVNIVTKEDLMEFRNELIQELKEIFSNNNTTEQKLWLKSSEVKKLLHISSGTLQNLRINGTLSYSKIGGTLYYSYKDIQKLLMDSKH